MAIIQISRIQNRTGNLADLPQLAPGELGWADDARRLFIGNEISHAGDQTPNNTEILTQYSNISFNQVASVVNPQNYDVVQYDAANAQWVNQQIYLTSNDVANGVIIHSNLTVTGSITPISNSAVKITGGSSGDVLTTDGTGNLIWAAGSGGGGSTGTPFTITGITAGTTTPGTSTIVTASNLAVINADPVIFTGIVSTGNIATVLNGNVFYVGNVNVGAGTVQLYTDSTLTVGVATTGTYTSGGLMVLRTQASGSAGAVQLSDGLGHLTTATGLSYSAGLSVLSTPKLAATNSADNALFSGGGANVSSNLWVGGIANVIGNARIGGTANVIGNLNVSNNTVITGNASVSNNATITGNISIGGTATIAGNTAISGANVTLGTVSNLHISGGTNQIALAGTVTIVGGVITSIAISDGGSGYAIAPTITIGGANTGLATATASILGGVVQSPLTIVNGGSGYNSGTVTVTISPPTAEFLTTDGRGNLSFAPASLTGAVVSGTISMWPTATAPGGYLLCDGSAVSRTTFSTLFALFGSTFGDGDGATTFNLPNYTDAFPIGAGNTVGIGDVGGSADAVVVAHSHTAVSNSVFSGSALGVHTHSATSIFAGNALGAHTHSITDIGHTHDLGNSGQGFGAGSNPVIAPGSVGAPGITDAATTGITIDAASAGTPTGAVSTTISNVSAGVPAGTVSTVTMINSSGSSGTNKNLPPFLGIFFIIKT